LFNFKEKQELIKYFLPTVSLKKLSDWGIIDKKEVDRFAHDKFKSILKEN
jgi:hypothetical protein